MGKKKNGKKKKSRHKEIFDPQYFKEVGTVNLDFSRVKNDVVIKLIESSEKNYAGFCSIVIAGIKSIEVLSMKSNQDADELNIGISNIIKLIDKADEVSEKNIDLYKGIQQKTIQDTQSTQKDMKKMSKKPKEKSKNPKEKSKDRP